MRDDDLMLDDPALDELAATASGIIECLRMLADEAASLRLSRTTEALRRAILLCRAEYITPPDSFADENGFGFTVPAAKLH